MVALQQQPLDRLAVRRLALAPVLLLDVRDQVGDKGQREIAGRQRNQLGAQRILQPRDLAEPPSSLFARLPVPAARRGERGLGFLLLLQRAQAMVFQGSALGRERIEPRLVLVRGSLFKRVPRPVPGAPACRAFLPASPAWPCCR